jgi:hypothetical protein
MNAELRDACIAAVQQADAPRTAARIGSAARGGRKPSAKFSAEVAEALADSGVSEWPRYRGSRIFWHRSFRNSVEDAFVKALDSEPLTVSKAAGPVSKLLQRVSASRALPELKAVAPQLAAAGRILQVAVNRQSVIYLSFDYLRSLIPARGREPSPADSVFADSILGVMERLQSGPGNYVRIDRLRNTPEFRRPLDDAAIALTEEGRLVLARYDGPQPVADEDKWNYIEDKQGELFIALAIRRSE